MNKNICSGIYCIFNLVNGKVYVGQAIDLGERYYDHWRTGGVNKYHNKYVNRAFKKYGVDSFVFVILNYIELTGDVLLDIKHLDELEQFYIDYFQAAKRKYGYNIREIAGSNLGITHDFEWIENNRQALLKYYRENPVSGETRRKISLANSGENSYWFGKTGELSPLWGTHPNQETLDKMSKAQSGENHWNWGGHPSQETLNRMSKAQTGENNAMYGSDRTTPGKEVYLHLTNGKYYFEINTLRFCKEFDYNPKRISDLVTGTKKAYKGITGERAPKWMVDKVKPLMGEGIYWVEIDTEGNILGE